MAEPDNIPEPQFEEFAPDFGDVAPAPEIQNETTEPPEAALPEPGAAQSPETPATPVERSPEETQEPASPGFPVETPTSPGDSPELPTETADPGPAVSLADAGPVPESTEPRDPPEPQISIRDVSDPEMADPPSEASSDVPEPTLPQSQAREPVAENVPARAEAAVPVLGEVETVREGTDWNAVLDKERAMRAELGSNDDPWKEMDATGRSWMDKNFGWIGGEDDAPKRAMDDRIEKHLGDYDRRMSEE